MLDITPSLSIMASIANIEHLAGLVSEKDNGGC